MDVARLIKIKEGTIRSKLDLLNSKMEEMDKIDDPEVYKSRREA